MAIPQRNQHAAGPLADFVYYLPLSEAAQRAALGNDMTASWLAANTTATLHPEVWSELRRRFPTSALACQLAGRPLTEVQLSELLGNESRVSVLVAALAHNVPTAAQRQTLYGLRCAGKVLTRVDTSAWGLDDDETRQVAWLASGSKLLSWINDRRDDFDDPDLIAALAALDGWTGRVTQDDTVMLARIVGQRTAVLDALCAPTVAPAIAIVAAAHPLLHNEASQQALATRHPCDHGFGTDAGTRQTVQLWTELVRNPATTTSVLHALHAHLTQVVLVDKVACRWGTFRWQGLVTRVENALDERRSDLHDPAVHTLATTTDPLVVNRALYLVAPSETNRWLPSYVYAAVELAANRHMSARNASRLVESLCHPRVVAVLGEAEAQRLASIVRQRGDVLASWVRVPPPQKTVPPVYHDRMMAYPRGERVPLWHLHRLDAPTAARVVGALHDQASWEALYALLGDRDVFDDSDLGELICAAGAIGGEVPVW